MVALGEQYAHMKPYLRPLMNDGWEKLDAEQKMERFRLSCLKKAPHLMETWDTMDRVGKSAWAMALVYCELAIRRAADTPID